MSTCEHRIQYDRTVCAVLSCGAPGESCYDCGADLTTHDVACACRQKPARAAELTAHERDQLLELAHNIGHVDDADYTIERRWREIEDTVQDIITAREKATTKENA